MRSEPGPLPAVVPRFEDERLITGRGKFVGDLEAPDALAAWFVRSPFAHGELTAVDTEFAAGSPGVVAVYTAADLDLPDQPVVRPGGVARMDRPMLARDRVRFVGEAVAVVVAESAAAAEEAAGLIFVEVDPLEAVIDAATAARDEAIIHPAAGTNVAYRQHTVAGPDLPPDTIDVTVTVEHARLAPSPLEAMTILATPVDDGLHVHVGVQGPHELRRQIAGMVGLAEDNVRVTSPDVGGAFGMKRFYPEYAVIAKAALLLGRPVRWAQPRREFFLSGSHGRAQRHEVTLSATADGRVHGARIRLLANTGAYPHRGVIIPIFSRLVASGLYDIPRVDFEIVAAVTNQTPTAPYRGAGRPEAALAIERAMDALAAELDLDPAEVRRRNMVTVFPHETATGAVLDSGDYRAALDRALEIIGYDDLRREQQERRLRGDSPLGIGIGAFVERAGGQPDSWEYGRVEIDEAGTVVARIGSTNAGQGHETIWRRIAAEAFDIDPAAVNLYAGDTELVADSVGSFASRSAQIGGSALWRSAERVRVVAAEIAADLLEASPDDIRVSAGAFHVAGSEESRVTLAEIAKHAAQNDIELASDERYSPGVQTFPYGVHVAAVEVDTDTGLVTIRSLVTVDDVGNILDPMLVEGQLHGSVMQGVAAALFEEMRYTEDGQPLVTTFVDYLMPTAVQAPPRWQADHVTSPAPSNPLGAKGAGEGGCIGMPPAILNATIDALRHLGVEELQIPLTPHKVWSAIHALESAGPEH